MTDMRRNEQGMASILVTMVMIIVISLIVLGFVQVTRRNQREALDNQLSTQAYYAAESGVNAAVNYISAHAGYNTNTTGNCQQFINRSLGVGANVLDRGTNTKYSCLMVDPTPTSLNLSPLTQESDEVLHIQNEDSQPITMLKFQWAEQANSDFPDTNPANNCNSAAGGSLPAYHAWDCPFGIVRLDLVDGTNANISNTTLENSESVTSFYLIPSYQTGPQYKQEVSMSSSPAQQPVDPTAAPGAACDPDPAIPAVDQTCPVRVVHVQCSVANGCSLKIRISGVASEYYARLGMMYQDTSSLTITGADGLNPLGSVQFARGQAVIDSTGQSQDELRRVEVRVPLVTTQSAPAYGLQATDSICKELTITSTNPGSTARDNCNDR